MPNPFDAERAERAVKELLIAIGEDPNREGLKEDRKSTRLNSSHVSESRMPSSA